MKYDVMVIGEGLLDAPWLTGCRRIRAGQCSFWRQGQTIRSSITCPMTSSAGWPFAATAATALLTKSTAMQYAGEGIRANSVHPGLIDTPVTEGITANPANLQRYISGTPLGRRGEPDDVAYGVLISSLR